MAKHLPHHKPEMVAKINVEPLVLTRKAPDVAEVKKAGLDLQDDDEEDSEEYNDVQFP